MFRRFTFLSVVAYRYKPGCPGILYFYFISSASVSYIIKMAAAQSTKALVLHGAKDLRIVHPPLQAQNQYNLTKTGIKNHNSPIRHRSPNRYPRNRPLRLRSALLLPRTQWRLRRPRTHVPRPRVLRHSHSHRPQRNNPTSRRPRRARSRPALPQMLPLPHWPLQHLPRDEV